MKITTQQIKRIHISLPNRIKLDKTTKGDFIAQFTENPEKRSTKDLTFKQANTLLKSIGALPVYATVPHYARFDKNNKQHTKILSICRTLGWTKYSEEKKRLLVDYEALSNWLHDYGYKKKALMYYTPMELPRLVTQFEKLLKVKS